MATGDITAVVIGAEGWYADITIAGLAVAGTYDFGFDQTNNNNPIAAKVVFTVTSLGYDGTGSANTTTRTVYGTKQVRTPFGTSTVAGSFTTGTFVAGETVTQAVSSATGIVVIDSQSAGAVLMIRGITGTPNNSGIWTGGTSLATFTPTATPATYNVGPREFNNGTSLIVRVALSEYIYQKDNTGGGNSGTAVTYVIAANFYTKTTASNVASGTATNNSTAAFPLVIGQWDHIAGVCAADRVAADFAVAFNAHHKFDIAVVRFDATGGTSGHVETVYATVQTATKRSASGLYLDAYVGTIPVSGFTTGESIALRARAYPIAGDSGAVLDTDSFTTNTDEILGHNKATVVYLTTIKYAYIDVVSGSNSNTGSTTLATAIANPIQHIGKAIQNDCTVIYLKNGQTHPAVGTQSSTRRTTNEWYVVQPESGHSSSDTTVQFTTTQSYKCQRLRYENVKLTLAGTTSWLSGDNADNSARFTNCVFDGSGIGTPSVGPNYQSMSTFFENCTGDLSRTEWFLSKSGVDRVVSQFDGCTMVDTTTGASKIDTCYRLTACKLTGDVNFDEKATANPGPQQDRIIIENNWCLGRHGNIVFWDNIGKLYDYTGLVIAGNVCEVITGSNPIFWVAADACEKNFDNCIAKNNTTAGDRWNFGYNDGTGGGGAAITKTRANWTIKNNVWESEATKHDTFTGTAGNGARVLGWPVLYGVGFSGIFNAHIDGISADTGGSASFLHEFIGLNSYQPALTGSQPPGGNSNVTAFVKFFDREAYSGSTGAANGNYRLNFASIGAQLKIISRGATTDLFGNKFARGSGSGAIAIQPVFA